MQMTDVYITRLSACSEESFLACLKIDQLGSTGRSLSPDATKKPLCMYYLNMTHSLFIYAQLVFFILYLNFIVLQSVTADGR